MRKVAMTTIMFPRSLKPITDFAVDDIPLTSGELVARRSTIIDRSDSTTTMQLFIMAFLDHVAKQEEPTDADKRKKLLATMQDVLIQQKIIPSNGAYQIRSVRKQSRIAFAQFIKSAMRLVNPEMNADSAALNALEVYNCSRPSPFSSISNWFSGQWSEFDEEYTSVEPISQGAYGTVYKAKKKSDGKTYAVKKIVLEAVKRIEDTKTFREVQCLAELSHPNIVRYYSCWVERQIIEHTETEDEYSDDDDPNDEVQNGGDNRRTIDSRYNAGNGDDNLNRNCNNDVDNNLSDRAVNEDMSRSRSRKDSNMSDYEVVIEEEIDYLKSESLASDQAQGSSVKDVRRERPHRIARQCSVQKSIPVDVLHIQMELCTFTLKDFFEKRNEACPSTGLTVSENGQQNHQILKQILKGIEYIHRKDIYHRDIKPLNIFMTHDGEHSYKVSIGDFGLARYVSCDKDSSASNQNINVVPQRFQPNAAVHTAIGHDAVDPLLTTEVGTDLYSSPEQLKKGSTYNNKCDMYSIGLVMCELYSSFKTDQERHKTLTKLRRGKMEPRLEEQWPREASVIRDLTHSSPDRRPSASDVLRGALFLSKDQVIESLEQQLHETREQLQLSNRTNEELKRELAANSQTNQELEQELTVKNDKIRYYEQLLEDLHLNPTSS